MQIIIDTKTDSHDDMRAAAAFLLHIVGDLNADGELNEPAPKIPSIVPLPPPAMPVTNAVAAVVATPTTTPSTPTATASVTNFVPPPPPVVPADSNGEWPETDETGEPESNVLPFPVPPPPPPPPIADTAATTTPVPPAPSAAGATTVVSVEVDSAGMRYDARIHQKGRGKKKDLTWKLIKGIDPAVVAAVTAELAASKGAVAPVSLPQTQQPAGAVPVPPVPPAAAASVVPTPPVAPPVPVPPVAPVGPVGGVSPYRALIERITTATKDGKITPARVNELCQLNGVPNLMQLNNMPDKLPDVSAMIDAAIAGLA